MKSMLQQFDSQLGAKETFIHDQRSKLSEKDKVILNQRTEMDRLEKKTKTLEYKVSPSLLAHLFCNFLNTFEKGKDVKSLKCREACVCVCI